MKASGIFVFMRKGGSYYVVNPQRRLTEKQHGFLFESGRIRYTKYLEIKMNVFIPRSKLATDQMLVVDPWAGSGYLIDVDSGMSYTYTIHRSPPTDFNNVQMWIETRTG